MFSEDRRQAARDAPPGGVERRRRSDRADLPAGVERRRQRAVDSLGLSAPVRQQRDDRFDRITRLAARVFHASWSSITVLDGDQAWFPSAQGFDIPLMPRQDTFCSRTTHNARLTVVPDASLDPDFAGLPAVVNDGIRFYAGVPLTRPAGQRRRGPLRLRPRAPDHAGHGPRDPRGPRRLGPAGARRRPARWLRAGTVQKADAAGRPDPTATTGTSTASACPPWRSAATSSTSRVTNGVVHIGLGDVMGKGTGAALVGAGVRAAVRSTHPEVVGRRRPRQHDVPRRPHPAGRTWTAASPS